MSFDLRRLSLDDKFTLCRSIAEECTTDDELRKKLQFVEHPVAYDGFEPSGRMHIAQAGRHGTACNERFSPPKSISASGYYFAVCLAGDYPVDLYGQRSIGMHARHVTHHRRAVFLYLVHWSDQSARDATLVC